MIRKKSSWAGWLRGPTRWSDKSIFFYIPLVRHLDGSDKSIFFDIPLVRHPVGLTSQWSDIPMVQHPDVPVSRWSDISS